MGEHDEMLPQCAERFDGIAADMLEVKTGIREIKRAVCGPNGKSLTERVAGLETRWILFAVLAGLIAAVSALYAAAK